MPQALDHRATGAEIVTLLLDDRGASPKPRHELTLLSQRVSLAIELRSVQGILIIVRLGA